MLAGLVPKGFIPKGFIPKGFIPKGFIPKGFIPKGFIPKGFISAGFIALSLAATSVLADPPATENDSVSDERPVAVVGDRKISREEFLANVHIWARQRFFHGKVSAEKMAALRREVMQAMIDRMLLVEEARQRSLTVRKDAVNKKIAQYEQRYQGRPAWKQNRKQWLVELRVQLEEADILEQLKTEVKTVPPATAAELHSYYAAHPEKFTTPERVKVSVILLKVEPSSPAAKWQAAVDEAKGLVRRLGEGADFTELARLHSGDSSASHGGDLGFVHKGMLAATAQQALDKLQPGEISPPVRLLQGIAIFKLHERMAPQRLAFAQAQQRVKVLSLREKQDQAWSALLEHLRSQTNVSIDEQYIAGTQVN